MAGKKAKPRPTPATPSRKETPRTLPDKGLPGSANSHERICWRFTHVDNGGPWGFSSVDGSALAEILGHLKKFESMTLNEVFHNGGYPGKDYDVDAIPNTRVLACLEALGLADQTKIWVLRCGGKPRLYGFLLSNVFHVVFWDPEHEIWPSQLKHT
jgi:hypothetical protein